jgi:hypothetical protein
MSVFVKLSEKYNFDFSGFLIPSRHGTLMNLALRSLPLNRSCGVTNSLTLQRAFIFISTFLKSSFTAMSFINISKLHESLAAYFVREECIECGFYSHGLNSLSRYRDYNDQVCLTGHIFFALSTIARIDNALPYWFVKMQDTAYCKNTKLGHSKSIKP